MLEKLAVQSRTIRRRSIVLEARSTNLTMRENCYHRSKTRHVNGKCECEHNIRETGRGGILRQSQRPNRFYAAAVHWCRWWGEGALCACAPLFTQCDDRKIQDFERILKIFSS